MQTQLQSETNADVSANVLERPNSTMRLRILHVVSRLGLGGTENTVLKVINELGHDQFEHQICAVRGIDKGFARSLDTELTLCEVGSSEPGFQFPLFRLLRIMKGFRPHIVHSRNFGALEAIPAARLAGIPVAIHSEHGYEIEILRGLPLRRRIACFAFFRLAHQVFTVTRDLKSFHSSQSWLSSERFHVIPNGVDTDRFCPHPEIASLLKSELGIAADRIVVGSVGRVVPIKDHKTLLEAAQELISQGKNLHVVIVGAGSELSKLQTQAATSTVLAGRVSFVGSSNRVPDLLNCMDVFVLPSISEGMSNTILEAMATGLPVVVTRTGGNPEVVEEGRAGFLFDPRNVRALTDTLSRLVDDAALRRECGSFARRHAVQNLSLSAMAQRYRDLYLELATCHSSAKGR
jgi:sugar transferase (PEP-CTERM/EpsH1 system associated)